MNKWRVHAAAAVHCPQLVLIAEQSWLIITSQKYSMVSEIKGHTVVTLKKDIKVVLRKI